MVVEVVFETHATTDDNEKGDRNRLEPWRLSAAGREQARSLGERRREESLAAIFTSDLARAVETVGIAFGDDPKPHRIGGFESAVRSLLATASRVDPVRDRSLTRLRVLRLTSGTLGRAQVHCARRGCTVAPRLGSETL
jgi:hypothetical protein